MVFWKIVNALIGDRKSFSLVSESSSVLRCIFPFAKSEIASQHLQRGNIALQEGTRILSRGACAQWKQPSASFV
jgi:hypothetical protein